MKIEDDESSVIGVEWSGGFNLWRTSADNLSHLPL
jgi:hypothetical protein